MMCVWQSMRPGSRVARPRSMTVRVFRRVRLESDARTDLLDAIAFDPDGGVLEVGAFADVEEACCFQDYDAVAAAGLGGGG